jgi:catechol 2,3-dioxygenase-like lactoylglutathione lyase family enzyme
MIELHRLHHVCLRAGDLNEAAARWSAQFGLHAVSRAQGRVLLSCDDEPYSLELIRGAPAGLAHVAYELANGCSLEQAREHITAVGAQVRDHEHGLLTADADGVPIQILPYQEPASRFTPHARPLANPIVGHPRKLGHVNFLTGQIQEQVQFYTDVLGMGLTDWLGDGGAWLHINSDHHVMALVNKGYPHFHHLAFDLVDFGQMRVALDHLGRQGRWLGWGPARHGVGGNIASYVRITEEECFVELYCDMEKLERDHRPRVYPDDRYSSNTWGPLPPRSYFRFDAAAIESERESLEMRGQQLPPMPEPPPPSWLAATTEKEHA